MIARTQYTKSASGYCPHKHKAHNIPNQHQIIFHLNTNPIWSGSSLGREEEEGQCGVSLYAGSGKTILEQNHKFHSLWNSYQGLNFQNVHTEQPLPHEYDQHCSVEDAFVQSAPAPNVRGLHGWAAAANERTHLQCYRAEHTQGGEVAMCIHVRSCTTSFAKLLAQSRLLHCVYFVMVVVGYCKFDCPI